MSKKIETIEETIIEMAKERIRRNGQCCISVKNLGRSVARRVGLAAHNTKAPSSIYRVVDTILKELGGKFWSSSPEDAHLKERGFRKFSSRVYKFEKGVIENV